MIGMSSDEDTAPISQSGMETYFGHFPSGSSFRNLTHFRQNVQTGRFAKFDFGKEENLKKYGSELPPEYDLTKISGTPIALFCGLKDKCASKEDYQWTKEQLGDNVVFYKEYEIGHMAFLMPESMEHILEMLTLMKKYNLDNPKL